MPGGWKEALRRSFGWLRRVDDSAAYDGSPDSDVRAAGDDTGITPQDYLEKIFQISFWLEPMTASRAASYLASLVRAPLRDLTAEETAGATDPQQGSAGTPAPQNSKIEIAPIELDYMRALAAYIGPSPRRVKRLVNAYRLIKARMSDAQLSAFVTEGDGDGLREGLYQIVIGLLVIGTGAQCQDRWSESANHRFKMSPFLRRFCPLT